jgi:oxygen-dependent protoporphyrinogen oxidase
VGLTVLAGCTAHAEIIDWPEERILGAVLEDVRRGLGPIPDPVFRHMARWPRAIPQYNLGHGRVVREVQTLERSFPGLHLLGAYLRGPSVADCVASGAHVARSILGGVPGGSGDGAVRTQTAVTPI